ncbi:hypothetical protein EMIT0196P_40004 [Pseudomonas chlororaphis]
MGSAANANPPHRTSRFYDGYAAERRLRQRLQKPHSPVAAAEPREAATRPAGPSDGTTNPPSSKPFAVCNRGDKISLIQALVPRIPAYLPYT